MAIDTRNKRFSLVGLGEEWFNVVLPDPDGAIDIYDRTQLLGGYAGIPPAPGLDTRDKRFSMIGVGEEWFNTVAPTPDGSIDSKWDRRQLLGMYRGSDEAVTELAAAALTVATSSGVFTTEIPLAGAAVGQSSATGGLFVSFEANAIMQALAAAQLATGITLVSAAAVRAFAAGALESGLSVGAVPTLEFTHGLVQEIDLSPYGSNFVAMLFAWGAKGAIPGITFDHVTRRLKYDGTDLGLTPGAPPVWRDGNQITLTDGAGFSSAALGRPDATGTLTADNSLAGAAAARGNAVVTITTQIPLTGAALARVAGIGELTVGPEIGGQARGEAAAAAALTTQIPLAGQAFGSVLAGGVIGAPPQLAGSATIVAQAGGVLTTFSTFQGAAIDRLVASGGLTIAITLAAEAKVQAGATGTLGSAATALVVLDATVDKITTLVADR